MTRIGSYHTPSGNIVELHAEEGRYWSSLYCPVNEHDLSYEEAREQYKLCIPALDGRRERVLPVGQGARA